MYSRVLITGGAGFVGSSLALHLKRTFPSMEITVLDNLRRRGSELNIARLRQLNVTFVHGDIRNSDDLNIPGGPAELILECSAEPSAQAGYGGSPQYLIDTNLAGCFNCLELARKTKADFLFLSTSRVYPVRLVNELAFEETETRFALSREQTLPGASGLGIDEYFPTNGARSLYGMTKLAAELMITEYADAYGIRSIINRCGLLAGPWQMGKTDQGVIALWMAAHYFKLPLSYIGFGGTGKQVRDILHIDDLCDLVSLQISDFDRYSGSIVNAGGGLANSLSLREMTGICEQISGNRIPMGANAEDRRADIRIYLTNHNLLTQLSGWAPKRSPQTTLLDIHTWVRANEGLLRTLFT